jgi:hypothetical protein
MTNCERRTRRKENSAVLHRFLMLLLPAIALAGQNDATAHAVQVCSLFADPAQWSGMYVKVSGTLLLSQGGEDGPLLTGPKCTSSVAVDGRRSPNTIYLANPKSQTRLHEVDFELDEDSRQLLNSLESRASRSSASIRVTVEGLFETRTPIQDLIRREAAYPWNGFGHMGRNPAQILVRSVRIMRNGPRQP